jgi:hypothetical protein
MEMEEVLMDENEDVIVSFRRLGKFCFLYVLGLFSFPNLMFMFIKINIINLLFWSS